MGTNIVDPYVGSINSQFEIAVFISIFWFSSGGFKTDGQKDGRTTGLKGIRFKEKIFLED